jgi:hypothetical protein
VTLRAAGYLMIAPGSGEAEAVGLSVDGENLEPGMAQPRGLLDDHRAVTRRVTPAQCRSPARPPPTPSPCVGRASLMSWQRRRPPLPPSPKHPPLPSPSPLPNGFKVYNEKQIHTHHPTTPDVRIVAPHEIAS